MTKSKGNTKGHHLQLSNPQISDEQFVEAPVLSMMRKVSGIPFQTFITKNKEKTMSSSLDNTFGKDKKKKHTSK